MERLLFFLLELLVQLSPNQVLNNLNSNVVVKDTELVAFSWFKEVADLYLSVLFELLQGLSLRQHLLHF